MVNNKVNDMFEQQQNTGKSASLAEKYANAVGQLSEANARAAHAVYDLLVERVTRQDLIDEEGGLVVLLKQKSVSERSWKLNSQIRPRNWRNVIRLWISVSLL